MNNYEKICLQWQSQFTQWDHVAQMKNLGFHTYNEISIFLTYLTVTYEINRKTGQITILSDQNRPVPFSYQMALYHILHYAQPNPTLSGQWVPFRDVPRAGPFDGAFQRTTIAPMAAYFSGKPDLLRQRAAHYGFPFLSHGDVSFLVELFPNLHLSFIFWDGDEEFPAQFNILFDKNIVQFTHEETVVMMADNACTLLQHEPGQEFSGNYN